MIIWLASYPKSGNTLLRSILSSYFYSNDGIFTFENLEKISQFPQTSHLMSIGVDVDNEKEVFKNFINAQNFINKDNDKVKFFKTHSSLCKMYDSNFTDLKNTLGAIYIVRDPRNVVTSLAHHYQISKDEALKFMLDKNRAIVSKDNNRYTGFQPLFSWEFNVNSWVNNKLFPVLIVRYEDLQKETFVTFKNIIDFINKITKSKKSLDNEKIKNCIESTKFENMQKLEKEQGFVEAITKKNSSERDFGKIYF